MRRELGRRGGHGDRTHQGDFKGIPGTGKSVGWTFMEIAEFKDGKLRALRAYRDNVNIYKQLAYFR